MNTDNKQSTTNASSEQMPENLGTTEWLEITQTETNTFAQVTRDMDPLHIDPVAAADGPFGHPIVFGFHTLSLLTYFSHEITRWEEQHDAGLNYGFNKVRFLEKVPVGARVIAHFALISRVKRTDGSVLSTKAVEIEIEGKEKPALVAEWLGLALPKVLEPTAYSNA